MKPIKFKGQNHTFAKDQPEYLDLPVFVKTNEVTSCWKLNILEKIIIIFTGRLWLKILTFGKPLQPQLPTVSKPFKI